MKNSYTFTARSAIDSRHVATFTLYDRRMAVNVGTALAEVSQTLTNGDEPDESVDLEHPVEPLLKPTAAWLIQRAIRPFNIADVEAKAPGGDGLWVRAWVRAGGRRVAPITLDWQEVDNPEASEAFVEEIQRRKAQTVTPGKYPGPLDYWATWLALAVASGVFLLIALRRLGKQESTTV